MRVKIRGFTCPKVSESYTDNFDRYNYSLEKKKFAMSDGVTVSFFPEIWANLLVNNFVKNNCNIEAGIPIEIDAVQQEWYKQVQAEVSKPNTMYYVRNAFKLGHSGSATFIGLQFFVDEIAHKVIWKSWVLGDSFMFYKTCDLVTQNAPNCRCIRTLFKGKKKPSAIQNHNILANCKRCSKENENTIENSICPKYINEKDNLLIISSREDLNLDNSPDYLDSRNNPIVGIPLFCEGEVANGTIYLMTDALSDWFIQNQETAYDIISTWKTHDDFITSIEQLRKNDMLKNDDSTILILEITEDSDISISYEYVSIDNIRELIKQQHNESEISDRG
jgi:hypothetical protein